MVAVDDVQLTTKSPQPPIYLSLGNPVEQTWRCSKEYWTLPANLPDSLPLSASAQTSASSRKTSDPVGQHLPNQHFLVARNRYMWGAGGTSTDGRGHFVAEWPMVRDALLKKRGHCPLLATPPPKRVKRGHLLSDYRQKCVNGTRDILMLKARKMTILAIIMF